MENDNISFAASLDRLKESFLSAAAQGGNTQDCAALLEIGADVNWRNQDGDTPLIAACRRGHTDTIALLLAHGADSNIVTNDSYAPIHICARRGDANSLDVLLAANTNTTAKTKNGQTALDIAKEKGHEAIYARIMRQRSSIPRAAPLVSPVTRGAATPVDPFAPVPVARPNELPAVQSTSRSNSIESQGSTGSVSAATRGNSRRPPAPVPSTNEVSATVEPTVSSNISGNAMPKNNDRVGTSSSSRKASSSTNQQPSRVTDPITSTSAENPPTPGKGYTIIGQSTTIEDQTLILRKLLDSEKVSRNILEAKLEVFAAQNKQLVTEFHAMSDEMALIQEENKTIKKRLEVYEGKKERIDTMTIEECEENEKLLKKSLSVIETHKAILIRNQIEAQKEHRLCVICQEKEKTVVLLPCRHMCLCDSCSKHDQLDVCPLCREGIVHKISVFS